MEALNEEVRFFSPQENIGADAFLYAMKSVYLDNIPYVICTDGDLELEDVSKTIDAQIEIIDKNPEVLCVGSRIRMDNLPLKTFPEAINWVPEFKDEGAWLRGPGPHHFLMFRGVEIWPMVKWITEKKVTWVDTAIGAYAEATNRKFVILKDHWHRHLSWDAYADLSHPYTQERLKRSFEETWKPLNS